MKRFILSVAFLIAVFFISSNVQAGCRGGVVVGNPTVLGFNSFNSFGACGVSPFAVQSFGVQSFAVQQPVVFAQPVVVQQVAPVRRFRSRTVVRQSIR